MKIDDYRHKKPRAALFIWAFTKGSLAPNPLPLTNKASWEVLKLHKDELREDGSGYETHSLEGCRILLDFGVRDDPTLAAEALHDTRESGKITDEELKIGYGNDVAHLVDNQTKRDGELPEDYYSRVASDVRSVLGKGADRLSNLGTAVGTYSIPRLKKYSRETKEKILPMIEEARHTSLEFSDPLVSLRDGLERILKVIDAYIEKAEKNEMLKELLRKHNIEIPKELFVDEPKAQATVPEPSNITALKSGDKITADNDRSPRGFIPLVDTVNRVVYKK